MLPSPGSMKLSRVTNWRARRWKFGVMLSGNFSRPIVIGRVA
jgi:hypothetical protein